MRPDPAPKPAIFLLRVVTEARDEHGALLRFDRALACDCGKLSARLGFDLFELLGSISADFSTKRIQRQLAFREAFSQLMHPCAGGMRPELSTMAELAGASHASLGGPGPEWRAHGAILFDRLGTAGEPSTRGASDARVEAALGLLSGCDAFELPGSACAAPELMALAAQRLGALAESREIAAASAGPAHLPRGPGAPRV